MTINLQKVYSDYHVEEQKARTILRQQDWYCRIVEFDPKTGEALPQRLSLLLEKIAYQTLSNNDGIVRDRLWRIVEHCRNSIERLFRSLNESPRREHALLPVHAVRELDANSFIKLSNRPGRTVREKLAGKPYMQAVRRFQSVDLPENRLLKALARHLEEVLEMRRYSLNHEDELLPKIQSWLRSEEAQAIGHWDNLPPNNTLLSHRDYRRVWDAWRWLQSLDEDISSDFAQLEARENTIRVWKQHAQMWTAGNRLFAEMPLIFDYERFEINPWSSRQPLSNASRQSIPRHIQKREINELVCVDFTSLRPSYASGKGELAQLLSDSLVWQQWKRDDESIDIELFHSDAIWLHPQSTTISAPDLLFATDNTSENHDRAARAFASHLREIFRHDTLIWLAPDHINDFELEVIRRNLNAHFLNAEPLPRSVAAVFAHADLTKVTGEGYAIVVVDSIGGKTTATKIVAKFDKNLANRLPITKGFYWERCPPVVIPSVEKERSGDNSYDVAMVDAKERWYDPLPPARHKSFDESFLKSKKNIGNFDSYINLTESPVVGGIRLHTLQQRAGDIPLWRNQIPELSIKVMKNGVRQRFHLVSRGTTVKPIRGRPVTISIDGGFTLPAGKAFYQFPLYIGDSGDDLGFSAHLNSPAFRLKNDVVCDLNLTFEYGADEPYKLFFAPRDKSFPPVRATWHRTEEVVITDAPEPVYPAPMTWVELRFVRKPDSSETSDLLDWVQRSIQQLDRFFYIRPKPREFGVITEKWRTDKKGGHYTFAACEIINQSVFIHQNSFVHGVNHFDFSEGQSISFELQERDGKYSVSKVAEPAYKDTVRLKDFDEELVRNMIINIRKRLYFPMIQVWRDGRSINDLACPKSFFDSMESNIKYFVALLMEDGIPESLKNEIRFLLACIHKDAPTQYVQWIKEQVAHAVIDDTRTIGFSLGDVSLQWQQDILSKLVALLTKDTLSIFAYAIWREKHFVERFNMQDLTSILDALNKRLIKIASAPQKNIRDKSWRRATAETMELLLGLLRTRASTDPEIKMLLQPHQKITRELAKQVERVTDIVVQSNVSLFSRVQLSIQKPEGDRTPDLLYALRLYLTGDDGANAIHIASISDGEGD